MEDVDCASSVVYARRGASAAAAAQAGSMLAAPEVDKQVEEVKQELGVLFRAQSAPVSLDPSSFKRNEPFSVAQMLRQVSRISREAESEEEEEEVEEAVEEVEKLEDVQKSGGQVKRKLFDDLDKLNLSGLLNVLDGVVDTPGRVVVMTTNHPEKLDPALIRPGRINKRIHLGFVDAETLLQMAKHYATWRFSRHCSPPRSVAVACCRRMPRRRPRSFAERGVASRRPGWSNARRPRLGGRVERALRWNPMTSTPW